MKVKHLLIIFFALLFFTLIYITIEKFNGIKEQYKTIEPNLENYTAAEVLFLSYERMKIALLSPDNEDDFLTKNKIFDSKIKIFENKASNKESFFYDDEFIYLIKKVKEQSINLRLFHSIDVTKNKKTLNALNYMNDIHSTLMDIQEVAYKIQIRNFNKTKGIIKDNSSDTEIYSILCITLSFILIIVLWIHITKLKETLLKKNIFISAIYHELSSSIQKIQISSELIDIRSDAIMAEKYIKNIKLHSRKIFDQTRDILEYSKIELGNLVLSNSTFYVKDLLNESLTSCDEMNKNAFCIKCNSGEKFINADKQKLLSILINLIDNSIKNTNTGTIWITLKLLDSHLYINVKDNGCGFEIKKLESLYRPFNQGAEEDTKQGLGLGLTIIKSYVKIFNGKIRVKSKIGFGSSFLICIPTSVIPR